MKSDNRKLCECVGLWLAEGDRKSIREITFTNNCKPLVRLFFDTISRIFTKGRFRIYEYSPKGEKTFNLADCIVKTYTDKRATKPYFILRYASTQDVKKWKKVVGDICSQEMHYPDILRGFVAGEGNIKTGAHSNRTIRIAQKKKSKLINKILDSLGISYSFSTREHSYLITGHWNWKKFYKYKVFYLHPEKREKFLKAWNSYKEIHYPDNFIRDNILHKMKEPKTSKELAKIFDRKHATLQEILSELKSEGKVDNYRVVNKDYWVRTDSRVMLISSIKSKILKSLEKPATIADVAKGVNRSWGAANNRLKELERLGLVRQNGYLWERTTTDKEVMVL